MADSGGHWATLAEAQKLTQSTKIPGVFEEDIKRNNPLERLNVAQAGGTGLKIEWLRENGLTEDAVAEANIGQALAWAEDVTYTEVETTLRYSYLQRKLDKYVAGIYGTYTNYQAQVLLEMEKGLKRKIGDRIIYGDTTFGGAATQFDGLHALAAERGAAPGGQLNINEGGALQLSNIRLQVDAMRFGVDEIWLPPVIALRFDAAYEEAGFASLAYNAAGAMTMLTRTKDEIGIPTTYFMGIPLIRTDYLVSEEDDTGNGDAVNARAKYSSTSRFSLFCIKHGNVMAREPGLTFGFGGTEGTGDFYDLWTWDRLESYNAGGMRMDTYNTLMLGSTKCLGRIFDITDAALLA